MLHTDTGNVDRHKRYTTRLLIAFSVATTVAALAREASAAPDARVQPDDQASDRVPTGDPTGGAYTSPTLLVIPAGAVPLWNIRVTALSEFQGPSQPPNGNTNPDAGIRPGIGVELGVPLGVTVSAGTQWVGGDVDASGKRDFSLGLSPFAQARIHIYGDAGGLGPQLGGSATQLSTRH